jgi:predicted DNA-binding protein
MQQNTTEPIRIPSELMEKIRKVSKENGQTYKGYITTSLYSIVNKDYNKLIKRNEKYQSKESN